MNYLIVIAHPLSNSLCCTQAKMVADMLIAEGHQVQIEDLYRNQFSPSLSESERCSYYQPHYDASAITPEIERLANADILILFFPTWWFSFPAILKGWFDRVWAPGIAYDHASDLGLIKPRLTNLKKVLAVTTLGSAWWVDRLIMRRPVKRVLKMALLQACAPQASFKILSLYKAEKLSDYQVSQFSNKIISNIKLWLNK